MIRRIIRSILSGLGKKQNQHLLKTSNLTETTGWMGLLFQFEHVPLLWWLTSSCYGLDWASRRRILYVIVVALAYPYLVNGGVSICIKFYISIETLPMTFQSRSLDRFIVGRICGDNPVFLLSCTFPFIGLSVAVVELRQSVWRLINAFRWVDSKREPIFSHLALPGVLQWLCVPGHRLAHSVR